MAYRIVWTPRAIQGFAEVLSYLNEHWTEKEINQFWKDCDHFFELLSSYPYLLVKSSKKRKLHRGPINRHTMVTYQVKSSSLEIVIINIRGAKQASDHEL